MESNSFAVRDSHTHSLIHFKFSILQQKREHIFRTLSVLLVRISRSRASALKKKTHSMRESYPFLHSQISWKFAVNVARFVRRSSCTTDSNNTRPTIVFVRRKGESFAFAEVLGARRSLFVVGCECSCVILVRAALLLLILSGH